MNTRDTKASARVARQRSLLAGSGGARVDAHLDAQGLARLDGLINRGVAASRREAINLAVSLLPGPPVRPFTGLVALAANTEHIPSCPFCGQGLAEFESAPSGFFRMVCSPVQGGCGASSGLRSNKMLSQAAWKQRI